MTDRIDDGGPAFPSSSTSTPKDGMTLLDWFAGKALEGQSIDPRPSITRENARWAYDQAREMIKEKRRREGLEDNG